MVDVGSGGGTLANGSLLLPIETIAAKEAKNRSGCRGKLLGCSNEVHTGLQYGLSGNSVPLAATRRTALERETASLATKGQCRGKAY